VNFDPGVTFMYGGYELGLRGRNWELNAGSTGEASGAEGSENLIFSPGCAVW